MANRNCKEDRLFDFTMDDRMMGCGCDGADYNNGCCDYNNGCSDYHNDDYGCGCDDGCNNCCDTNCGCDCDPCNNQCCDPCCDCDPCNNQCCDSNCGCGCADNCCDPCGNDCGCNNNCGCSCGCNNGCNNNCGCNNGCQTIFDNEYNCDVDAADSDSTWYDEVRRPHRPDCVCKPSEEQCRRCRELKKRIQHLDFALQEVTLYLDMHPCDCRALRYYHRIKCELDKCMALYERHCAPISNKGNENQYEWEWAQSPWPWEGQE